MASLLPWKGSHSPLEFSKKEHVNKFAALALDSEEEEKDIYVPLDLDRQEIRLLSLEPSAFYRDHLTCDLVTVSLLNKPKYRALSYVWGLHRLQRLQSQYDKTNAAGKDDTSSLDSDMHNSQRASRPVIALCGKEVDVAYNLFVALKRLRLKDRPLPIWVDALCINQEDIDERSQQVRLMSVIYADADEVSIVFDVDEHAGKWFGFIPRLIVEAANAWRQWNDLPAQERLATRPNNEYDDPFLRDFVDTSWWNRVWTVQEFLLAKSPRFYFYNDKPVTADDLDAFIKYMKAPLLVITGETAEVDPDESEHDYVNLDDLYYTTNISRLLRLRRRLLAYQQHVKALDFVAFSRNREASDLHDMVYSSAGMVPSLRELIDYRCTLQECYERFAYQMIVSSGDLDLFQHLNDLTMPSDVVWNHSSRRKIAKQPDLGLDTLATWAPNWSLSVPSALGDRQDQIRFYRACDGLDFKIQQVVDRKLRLSGVICGKVRQIGLPYPDLASKAAIADWLKLSGVGIRREGLDPQSTEYMSFRTCMCQGWSVQLMMRYAEQEFSWTTNDLKLNWRQDDRDEMLFSRFVEEVRTGKSFPTPPHRGSVAYAMHGSKDEYDQYVYFVLRSALGRRFSIDDKGRYGLVPGKAKVGDFICVLGGGKTPYVIRKKRKQQSYEILGDAYVNELMFGEAASAVAKGDLNVRELILR